MGKGDKMAEAWNGDGKGAFWSRAGWDQEADWSLEGMGQAVAVSARS